MCPQIQQRWQCAIQTRKIFHPVIRLRMFRSLNLIFLDEVYLALLSLIALSFTGIQMKAVFSYVSTREPHQTAIKNAFPTIFRSQLNRKITLSFSSTGNSHSSSRIRNQHSPLNSMSITFDPDMIQFGDGMIQAFSWCRCL